MIKLDKKEEAFAFSQALEELCEDNNMNYTELAREVETTPATIYMYRTAKTSPQSGIIVRIAKRFNVSADWLLGLSKKKRID